MFFYIRTFRSTCAVPNMVVVSSYLNSFFPVMLHRHCLSVSEMVPLAPIITGITFACTFPIRRISIVRFLYFRIFSASIWITFQSPETTTYINIHVPFSLSRIMMSGLLFAWFYRFALAEYITRLFHLQDQFVLIIAHFHTRVNYLIVPLFPGI